MDGTSSAPTPAPRRRHAGAPLALALRLATRRLASRPVSAGLMVLCLALAFGASALILAVIDAFVLRPLPFRDPERLVSVWMRLDGDQTRGLRYRPKPTLVDLLRENGRTVEVAPFAPVDLSLSVGREPASRISGAKVSGDFFRVVGIGTAAGRVFEPADEVGMRSVAIVSAGLAARLFPRPEDALGASLRLEGKPYEVIGVLASRAHFPSEAEAWIPIQPSEWAGPLGYNAIARLADGATVAEALAEIRRLGERVPELEPEFTTGGLDAEGLQASLRRRLGPILVALAASVALLFALACTNVTALAIGRASRCRGDRRIQVALGSTSRALFLDALCESVAVCAAGVVAGLFVAWWARPLLLASSPIPEWSFAPFAIDARVAVACLLAAGLLALGLATLTHGSREARARTRLAPASVLVVANTTVTVVLLVVAGLLAKTVGALSGIDPGFVVDGVQVVGVSAPPEAATGHRARARFFAEVDASLAALPGVAEVGGMHALPLDGASWFLRLMVEGEPADAENDLCLFRAVLPGTFRALGVGLLAGRDLAPSDNPDAPLVALVNRAFVERFLDRRADGGPASVLGLRFQAEQFGPSDPWTTIVGVVEDTVETSLEVAREPVLFLPHAQRDRRNLARMELLVRHGDQPPLPVATLHRSLAEIDPGATLIGSAPLASVVEQAYAGQSYARLLVAAFAVIALVQASAGIFGVAHFQANARRRELGLRLALGAHPQAIRRVETLAAVARAGVGMVLGSALAWFLCRRLEDLWVGVSAADPATYVTVAAIVVTTVVAATYGPTLRASRTDPTEILREQAIRG